MDGTYPPSSKAEVDLLVEMDALTRCILEQDQAHTRNEERLFAELERLQAVQRLGTLMSATLNLEQVLRVVASSLVKDMAFDRVLLYLQVEEGYLACRAWQGLDSRTKDALEPAFAHELKLHAVESDHPVLFSRLPERESTAFDALLAEGAAAHGAMVPFFSGRELLGGLVVLRVLEHEPIDLQDVKFLTLLANQMSSSVVNARLYRRIEDYSRNLEREVGERTRELFTAYRELQESKKTLVSSEKMAFLGQLTAGIAHEINTPVGAVSNSLKSLHDLLEELKASIDAPEVTPDDYREILAEMEQSLAVASSAIGKAARFVRGVKAQTRDLANVELRQFNPLASLDDLLILLQHETRKSNITIDIEADRSQDLSLFGDAGKFSQIFTNLINNSMDAYEGKPGQIVVRALGQERDVTFRVVDHGCGISEENKKRLFHTMFTTKWQGKGTGLGMSIVHGLVTGAFGGSIDVESEVGVGTTFTVRLPRRKPEEVLAQAEVGPISARS